MNAAVHQVQVLLARLSPREQRLVALFGSLLACVLAWSLLLSPLLSGPDRIRHEIDGLRGEVGELESLARQLRQVEVDLPKGGAAPKIAADF